MGEHHSVGPSSLVMTLEPTSSDTSWFLEMKWNLTGRRHVARFKMRDSSGAGLHRPGDGLLLGRLERLLRLLLVLFLRLLADTELLAVDVGLGRDGERQGLASRQKVLNLLEIVWRLKT